MKLRRRKGQAQAAPMSLSSEELASLLDRRSGAPRLGAQFRRCPYQEAAQEVLESLASRLDFTGLPATAIEVAKMNIAEIIERRFS